MIGEDLHGTPNNLVHYVAQVAAGKLPEFTVFGNDNLMHGGANARGSLHVVDLAEGRLCALEVLRIRAGVHALNLGSGHGCSVINIVREFEAASKKSAPYRYARRAYLAT